MTREEAKELFRNDKDSYGKPKSVMKKIDMIYNDFEKLGPYIELYNIMMKNLEKTINKNNGEKK